MTYAKFVTDFYDLQVKSGVMTRRQSAVAAAQGLLPEPKVQS